MAKNRLVISAGIFSVFTLLLALSGCASAPGLGTATPDKVTGLAKLREAGFLEQSPGFLPLRSWVRMGPVAADHDSAPLLLGSTSASNRRMPLPPIMVVFESDGAPWRASGYLPPANPSPGRPVGAEIAIALAKRFSGPVVYLGRHCQFIAPGEAVFTRRCGSVRLWTHARFAPEVVSDLKQWLHELVAENSGLRGRPWLLTGFSGGGTLAALLATELPHTVCLVTFAAPLDLRRWASLQRLSPLFESLDPADSRHALAQLPALTFWLGSQDRLVPPESIGRFNSSLAHRQGAIRIVQGLGHAPVENWITYAPARIQESCGLTPGDTG